MWACFIVVASLTAADTVAVEPYFGPTRDIFLTAPEVIAARRRCEREPWAREFRDKTLASARAALEKPLDIPAKGGQWAHWYSCEDDGARLQAKSPTEHVCPRCNRVYSGYPYDDVYVTQQHQTAIRQMVALANALYLEPDPAFAGRIREGLLRYAEVYPSLELHDVNNLKGKPGMSRLYAQTLDEAISMVDLVYAYDAVYDTRAFSEADHDVIAKGLLRPMLETIGAHQAGRSNWQSWHNAAIFCTAAILRDEKLMDERINGDAGLLKQLENSVFQSGFWHEPAPFYHWYALKAMVYQLEAAERCGVPLWDQPVVRKMFDAPLTMLFPDRTFPALNNSDRFPIRDRREFYEVAYRHFKDERYLGLVEPRDSAWALFWGADVPIPETPPPLEFASQILPNYGVGVLRNNTLGIAAYIDFNETLSSHLQNARLALTLYAQGDERLIDPGVAPYGNKLQNEWYTQALAHNTVVVNGQPQTGSSAKLAAYAFTDEFAIVRAGSDTLYAGVTLHRTLLLWQNVLIDVFRCESAAPASFDLAMHARGELADPPPSAPADDLDVGPSYKYLSEAEKFLAPVQTLHLKTGPDTHILVRVHEPSTAYRAQAPGKEGDSVNTIIRRRQGNTATFATSYQMLRTGEQPASVNFQYGNPLRVSFGNGTLELGDYTIVYWNGQVLELGREGIVNGAGDPARH